MPSKEITITMEIAGRRVKSVKDDKGNEIPPVGPGEPVDLKNAKGESAVLFFNPGCAYYFFGGQWWKICS